MVPFVPLNGLDIVLIPSLVEAIEDVWTSRASTLLISMGNPPRGKVESGVTVDSHLEFSSTLSLF